MLVCSFLYCLGLVLVSRKYEDTFLWYILNLNIFLPQKMIHSLFLINCSGDIFLEKHWKSVVSQSVCDYFFEAQEKAADVENVPPVISTPHHYLISIYRDKLFFVSVIQTEVPPLFVIEFLHRVADTFQVGYSSSLLNLDYSS